MERLKIRYLALILLLSGCQILEVTNDESIELIPDLSEPKNEETIESNQLVEVANIEPSVPEIISIWEVLKNEAVIKDYEIDDLTLYYMNQHLILIISYTTLLKSSKGITCLLSLRFYHLLKAVMIHSLYLHLEQLVYGK